MTIYEVRKKPISQLAVQWTGDNSAEIQGWTQRQDGHPGFVVTVPNVRAELWVAANKTWVPVGLSEWVLQDKAGFYPCTSEMFIHNFDLLGATQ